MARIFEFDRVTVGAQGVEPLQVGIDDLVRIRRERAARLHLPGRINNSWNSRFDSPIQPI
jgi:hypothetical protein